MQCHADENGLNGLKACVALGMFDGVHLGHQALLKTCIEKATTDETPAVVYTYLNSPHPYKQTNVQGLLTTSEEKLRICEEIGVHIAVLQRFTPEYRELLPEEFAMLLFSNNRVRTLVCGQDYRFGRRGKGDPKLLEKMGRGYGVEVICVEDVLFEGKPVSSTRIRAALLHGDCEMAARLLGRPYDVCALIENGKFSWPKDKARIACGNYTCSILDESVRVLLKEDGTCYIQDAFQEDCFQGSLKFLHENWE